LKNARERMDVISAYREVGTYRGAAAISGTTPKRHFGVESREAAARLRQPVILWVSEASPSVMAIIVPTRAR
jgi:hypothetical protein